MRTCLFVILLFVSNVLPAQRYSSFIKDLPKPARVVNDFGNFLSSGERNSLEKELISYRKKSGNAIVIIILSTLTDHKTGTTWSVEETSLQYFSKWGIGDKNKNNGVLLLVSKEPRRVRITTGTGVENKLSDNECQRIIDKTIVPNFKTGMFYTGLREGVNDIEVTLGGGTRSRAYSGSRVYSESGAQSENGVQSAGGAQAADNWATVDEPVQPEPERQAQPQLPTQNVSSYNTYRTPPTVGETILGFLLLAVAIWLRVRYVRRKDRGSGSNLGDYINATGWALLWCLKIAFGLFILIYMMFRRSGRSNYRRSSYYDGYDEGYDRGRSNGRERNSVSSGSSGDSGSSEGSGSYGGGRSNGGGASGSW